MKVLLFQIYGDQRVYHLELTYSILSAARFLKDDPDDIRIVLAADAKNQRPDLPVEHLLMTPEMLHEWQMGGTYNHAIQAYALHYAVQQFDAPVILIDSDTIIKQHPRHMFDKIRPGRALMHASEGRLQDSIEWPEWRALITRSGGTVGDSPVTPESVMFNAGVLGLDPQDAPLMDDVKAAMRDIRDHSDMFTAVQLAASLVLGAGKTELSVCDEIVEHYWGGPRAYYHYQMEQMFPGVLGGEGIADARIPLAALSQSPPVALRHRIAARIVRLRRGAGPAYGSAYLAYRSAIFLHLSNPKLANVWATKALNMLKWGVPDAQPHTADFQRFTPARLEAEIWMDGDLRKRWQDYWSSNSTDSKASTASQ